MAPPPEPGRARVAGLVEKAGPGLIEPTIFGATDPAVIAERLCELVDVAFVEVVVGARFYVASVGRGGGRDAAAASGSG